MDCQIDILAAQRTRKLILESLENLPGNLNDTYSRILNCIPVVDRKMVREALLWLCYALRPLTLEELCEAVVYETGDKAVDETCRLEPFSQLIQMCNGLVVMDEVSNTVTLAHSSVRDFLVGQHIAGNTCRDFALNELDSQRQILRKSLSYLSLHEIQNWHEKAQSTMWWSITYPLLNYIAQHWCLHARRCQRELDERDFQLVDDFLSTHRTLGTISIFAFWIQCLLSMNQDDGIDDNSGNAMFHEAVEAAQPLYYMASFDFDVYIGRMFAQKLISKSVTSGPWYIDHKCGRAFSTALQVASWRGSVRTVKKILAEGADPNSTNSNGVSCLAAAGIRDRDDIIKVLLENGAKLNYDDEQGSGLDMREIERRANRGQPAQILELHDYQPVRADASTDSAHQKKQRRIIRTGVSVPSEYFVTNLLY